MPCQDKKISVGVIGLGWWGPKLLRNFLSHERVEGAVGCDTDEGRRWAVAQEYNIKTVGAVSTLIEDVPVDAVVIATPPATHYEIAKLGLNHGKHILLTKPPTLTLFELEDLVRISEEKGLILMLDSAFVYAPSVQKMKSLFEERSFPRPTSVHSYRHGNDLHYHHISRLQNTMFRNEIDVLDDLLFHDLALFTHLFRATFHLKSIRRFYNLNPVLCDTAFMELESEHFPLHISLSWTLPERKRQILVFTSDRYLLFDDLREGKKLQLFEFETKSDTTILYEEKEPLFCEVDHFITCLLNGKKPLTDGAFMLQVMEIYDQIRHAPK